MVAFYLPPNHHFILLESTQYHQIPNYPYTRSSKVLWLFILSDSLSFIQKTFFIMVNYKHLNKNFPNSDKMGEIFAFCHFVFYWGVQIHEMISLFPNKHILLHKNHKILSSFLFDLIFDCFSFCISLLK